MIVNCPNCETIIPAANVDLNAGWGKCSACNDFFQLTDVLPGYVLPLTAAMTGVTIVRPFDAWARTDRASDHLAIHLPPRGMREGAWILLGFAVLWLGFLVFWTAGAFVVPMNQGQRLNAENIFIVSFSIPFWLAGLGMLGMVLWKSRGTQSVYMDAQNLLTEWTCSGIRRRRVLARNRVQHARASTKTSRYENGMMDVRHQVELVYRQGSFTLRCETPSEQQWLVAEINNFLRQVPADGQSFGDWPSAAAEEQLQKLKRVDTQERAK